jgi:hypothetical protein
MYLVKRKPQATIFQTRRLCLPVVCYAMKRYNDTAAQACPCGIIVLSYTAAFILHILRPRAALFVFVDEAPELQKIVNTKR